VEIIRHDVQIGDGQRQILGERTVAADDAEDVSAVAVGGAAGAAASQSPHTALISPTTRRRAAHRRRLTTPELMSGDSA
jgi:hypothetical protein